MVIKQNITQIKIPKVMKKKKIQMTMISLKDLDFK